MNHLAVTYSLGGEEAMEVIAALASDNSYVDRKKNSKQQLKLKLLKCKSYRLHVVAADAAEMKEFVFIMSINRAAVTIRQCAAVGVASLFSNETAEKKKKKKFSRKSVWRHVAGCKYVNHTVGKSYGCHSDGFISSR